jgi:secreted trypsin-like serine protease
VLLACGSPEPTGTSRAAIVNGHTDTADTSVVGIIVFGVDPNNDHECTGTVVSPHVVLTAAHCLDPAIGGAVDHVAIFLGTDLNDPVQAADPTNFAAVATTMMDPKFSASLATPAHDLGLVVAAQPLALAPEALNRSSLGQGDVAESVVAVGFGQVSSDTTTAGPRRSIDANIFSVDDEHITLEDVLCEGDSGGPTFRTKDGQRYVIGVHSFTQAANCLGLGDDTRVDVHTSFIDPVIDQYDPGFLPKGCNASGGSGDAGLLILLGLIFAGKTRRT